MANKWELPADTMSVTGGSGDRSHLFMIEVMIRDGTSQTGTETSILSSEVMLLL